MEQMLSVQDIITALQVLVALLAIIVLYHLMFITVDVRKIVRRFEKLTEEAEEAVMKPIAMADMVIEAALAWVESFNEEQNSSKKKSSKSKKSSKKK